MLGVLNNGWHSGLCFSPDRKLMASPSGGNIKIWDKETGKELNTMKGYAENNYDYVGGLVFSSDGKRLASCSEDKTVRIWDITTGNVLFVLKGHTDQVNNAAFSPDGKLLASVSNDKTVRLWDSEVGKEIEILKGHRDTVYDVAFSPDGKWLASGSDDKTIRIWDMRSYTLFLHDSTPTPLYRTFIEAVKFLWQLDVQGLEIVHKERTPADMKKFGTLLAPPPPGQSKFDQVLKWAEKQQVR
jgi:WD40 repeat protein